MLAAGALIGLVAGLLAVVVVGTADDEVRALVRLALLLPVATFVAWWLLVPGMALDRDEIEPDVQHSLDVDARIRQIQAAFDSTDVPRMGTHAAAPAEDRVRDELRRSIRRPADTDREAAGAYGARRQRRDLG